MKNSNERRLTPLHTFTNAPYNFDSSNVTYHAEVIVNAFKNIVKVSSSTGQAFLYDKEKLMQENVKRQIAYCVNWTFQLKRVKKKEGEKFDVDGRYFSPVFTSCFMSMKTT